MDLVIVGRDEPLARLHDFVRDVARAPASLAITGEAGIGKTTLWQAAVHDAVERGYTTLVSRPAESETALAYAGLADLLDGVDATALGALPPPQRRALEVALLVSEPNGPPPEPRAIYSALGGVLRVLAERAPVVVAIDDQQWLDSGSSAAIEFVRRRLRDAPIGILTATRTGSGTAQDGTETLPLAALSPAGVYHLVRGHVGVSLPRSSVLRVHRLAEGNPFYALELARVLVASGMPDATERWPVPDDLREVVAQRVGSLPRAVRSSLLVAAARGHPLLRELGPTARRAAEAAGIVSLDPTGAPRFAHPLLAAAIYDGATPADRRRVHASLAEREGTIEERARHRALSCDGPDEDVAVLLERAAASALARGSPDVAAELQATSVELTSADRPGQAWRRRLETAELHFRAGNPGRARELLLGLVGSPDAGSALARALELAGQACYHVGLVDDALGFLRRAIAAADGDLATIARAELGVAFVLLHSFGSFADTGAAAHRAVAAAEGLDDRALLSCALAATALTDLILGKGVDEATLERVLALEDRDRSIRVAMPPSLVVGTVLMLVDQCERARVLLDALRRDLVARGEDSALPDVLVMLARLECNAGNLAEARAIARESYELARQEGSESLAASSRALEALVDAHAGRVDEARASAADAIELARLSGWRLAAFHASWALGVLELSLGHDDAVVAILEPSIELIEAHGLVEPSRWPFLADAIEALVHVGQLDRADRLARTLEERGRELDRRSAIVAGARSRALVLASHGQTGQALAAMNDVLAEIPDVPAPLELARTLLVRGQLERRCKQRRAARASLERALGLCEQVGAVLWAERARAELARLGPAVDPDDLTATEQRVARLAAQGLSNREIAASAFISEKTVEANLSRIYRKLAIRSRAELGLRLAAREPSRSGERSG